MVNAPIVLLERLKGSCNMDVQTDILWIILVAIVVFFFIKGLKEMKYEKENKPSELPEEEWPKIYVWKDKEPWE